MKLAKPLTCTRETPTRKMWGKSLTGMGTGWPGIPQGYPWYSLIKVMVADLWSNKCRYEVIGYTTSRISALSNQSVHDLRT